MTKSQHCHIYVTGPKYVSIYADSGPESFSLRELPHFSLSYVTIFIAQLKSYSFFDSLKAIFSLLLNSISLSFVLYSLLLILRHLVLKDKPVADVIIQQCISHLLLPPTCLFCTHVSTGKGEIGKPFIFLVIISSLKIAVWKLDPKIRSLNLKLISPVNQYILIAEPASCFISIAGIAMLPF